PAGTAATFTLTVRVDPGAVVFPGQQSTVTNTVTVSSGTTDPDPADNSATATTSVNALADLGVALTDAPDPVVRGNPLTYKIALPNVGPSNSRQVQITVPIPAGTTFVSFAPPGFPWIASTPPVRGTGVVIVTPISP